MTDKHAEARFAKAREELIARTPGSAQASARAAKALAMEVAQTVVMPHPIYIERADGCHSAVEQLLLPADGVRIYTGQISPPNERRERVGRTPSIGAQRALVGRISPFHHPENRAARTSRRGRIGDVTSPEAMGFQRFRCTFREDRGFSLRDGFATDRTHRQLR